MNIAMDNSLRNMRIRYVAPVHRMLDDFWSWWTGELISVLPQSWQGALFLRDQCIRAEVEESDLVLTTGDVAPVKELGRVCLKPADSSVPELPTAATPIVLVLPADKVLVKRLTLPLAAEENLREVLSFEMDRQTPFSAEQVYYDSVILKRDTGSQALAIDLVLSPRNAVDDLVARLTDVGLQPDVVSTCKPNIRAVLPVNLLPDARRKSKSSTTRRLNIMLTAITLLLLAAAISNPLLQKQQVIRLLEPQVEQALAESQNGSDLRQQVQQLVDASTHLIGKKRTEPLVIRVFNEITRVLPDDTWINRLDISAQEIQLQGQSSSAAALISLLETSPLLQEVRFRSPVMRTPTTGEERFHVSAVLVREEVQ